MRVVLSLLLVAGAVSGQMLRGSSPPPAVEQAPANSISGERADRVDVRTGSTYIIYPGRRASAADAGPPAVKAAEKTAAEKTAAESIGKIERVDPRTGLKYLIYPGRRA